MLYGKIPDNREPYKGDEYHDPYGVLQLVMRHFGVSCSPKDFYWAVNEAYHSAESLHYDSIHRDMYVEEERVWKWLLDMLPPSPQHLTFLDIGCGTGLVGHFVSHLCPYRVGKMHLVDPCSAMLDAAREKTAKWPFRTVFHHGDVFSLRGTSECDVITINSVLHHVVDLEPFLRRVQDMLRPNGLLLIAQDPRHVAAHDSILCERKASVAHRLKGQVSLLRKIRHSIAPMIKSVLGLDQRQGPVAAVTNKLLLNARIIARPMDDKSIWAVTDFHVPDQPGGFGKGIDISVCATWMPLLKLAVIRTYHYHDMPWSCLTEMEQQQEGHWWAVNDPHGSLVASAFQKLT